RGVDGAGATLAPIRVDAQKAPALTQPLDTGSHLGLSPLETPASVEQINRATLAGVSSGDSPRWLPVSSGCVRAGAFCASTRIGASVAPAPSTPR
ncbi:hypothetical protein QM306_38250, partial [Burkholderia cenocepacia]|nr:hypothetical protein [Burkholderia cenocepacia]